MVYLSQLAPAAKLDGSGAVVERYIYATGMNSPDYIEKAGEAYRVVKDNVGSVRMIVRVSDVSIVKTVEYDEFGGVVDESGSFETIFGFAGCALSLFHPSMKTVS